MGDRSRLCVLIVNWNGWRDTIACLESIFKGDWLNCRVIVCDNGSEDGSLNFIKAWAEGKLDIDIRAYLSHGYLISPFCKKPVPFIEYDKNTAEADGNKDDEAIPLVLINIGSNLGFAGGNNVGLRYILSRSDPTFKQEYILLLNSDTVVFPNALAVMREFMDRTPFAGACGARLFYADSSPQPSYGCFPTIPRMLVHLFPLHKLFPQRLFRNFKRLSITPNEGIKAPVKIDYPSGACIMVRREVIDVVGLMDEKFFMYYEETDWCYSMRKAGWEIYYVPDAKIVHYCGGSFKDQDLRRKILSLESRLKFFKKNFPSYKVTFLHVMHIISSLYFFLYSCLFQVIGTKKSKEYHKEDVRYHAASIKLNINGLFNENRIDRYTRI
jgi:GT2 family glycosyltransferase